MITTHPGIRSRTLRVAASNLVREINTLSDADISPELRQRIMGALDNIAVCADRIDDRRVPTPFA